MAAICHQPTMVIHGLPPAKKNTTGSGAATGAERNNKLLSAADTRDHIG